MAYTAHKTDEQMEEIEWDSAKIDACAKEVAELIKKSKHIVFFTGAGISTSAGIPDYRGPQGAWTLAAKQQARTEKTVPMASAVPTSTHMALVALYRAGKLQQIISQNVDGLHRKSGIPADGISELHGNSNIEECNMCGKCYMRDFNIHSVLGNHYTGRKCSAEGCHGDLRDTIINFGENLSAFQINNGFGHSEKADLHICLGSSLTVRPACDMPKATKEGGGKLVVVNLQRTPIDQMCDIRVHGRVDAFIEAVMKHLQIPIPPFVLKRQVSIWRKGGNLCVAGAQDDGVPASLFEEIKCGEKSVMFDPSHDPATFPAPASGDANLQCQFFGHYREPDVELKIGEKENSATYVLEWDLKMTDQEYKWKMTRDDSLSLPSYKKGSGKPTRIDKISKPLDDGTGIDYSGWFAVTPLMHCQHCEEVALKENTVLDPQAPCDICANVGENMLCLMCWKVHCGRHVKQHAVSHNEETGHQMVCGFADLSFWCYPCESYITPSNKHLKTIYRCLHQAKFGIDPTTGRKVAEQKTEETATATTEMTRENSDLLKTKPESDSNAAVPNVFSAGGGFQVTPLADCVHCKQCNPDVDQSVGPNTPCKNCGNVGENMVCLICHEVHCGRHVKQHMLAHHDTTGHPMVMGFADLSVWCYLCDSYVDHRNKNLKDFFEKMHRRKFGE